MRILSLFDGMACGMLAMQAAGIKVDRYVAFEYDEKTANEQKGRPFGFAALTASHNFPMIEQCGNVFHADFTEFAGFDFVIGGSPCTKWSIAQKNDRETEASGIGWELFCQYARAIEEVKPTYFIYENNKSMHNNIRTAITETFGFDPICINSALVSAQNRQRLYWVGKRNPDGTYSKVHVEQPEDRGILLRDVLDGVGAKALTEREMDYMVRDTKGKYSDRWAYLQKPAESDKGLCITANVSKGVPYNICAEPVRIPEYGDRDKARPLGARYAPNAGGWWHRMFSDNPNKQQVDMVADPVCMRYERSDEAKAARKKYEAGEIHHGFRELSELHPRTDGKTNNLSTVLKDNPICCPAEWPFAVPIEFDEEGKPTKAISCADGKTYHVYEVKDGQITIKGKQYPIKLADGYYIIRKLTVSECKRLQTVPEWYEFPVSDSQAYKMLGNGWTVLVISWLLQATQAVCATKTDKEE